MRKMAYHFSTTTVQIIAGVKLLGTSVVAIKKIIHKFCRIPNFNIHLKVQIVSLDILLIIK